MGLKGLQDRGVAVFYSLDYVRAKRPRALISENAKGLTPGSIKYTLRELVNFRLPLCTTSLFIPSN